jgi:hypothetical protein
MGLSSGEPLPTDRLLKLSHKTLERDTNNNIVQTAPRERDIAPEERKQTLAVLFFTVSNPKVHAWPVLIRALLMGAERVQLTEA